MTRPRSGPARRAARDRTRHPARRPVLRPAARRLRRRGHQDRAARARATRCASGAARRPTASRCGGRSSRATRRRSRSTCARPRARSCSRRWSRSRTSCSRTSGPARWRSGASAGPSCRAINPRLIMIRVSGFGQTGPYSRQAGFGAIGEAMGGLRYVVGDPSTPPSRMGISHRRLAGRHVRLHRRADGAAPPRTRTGRGQVVDSAIYEAVLNMMESLVTEYDKAGFIRERTGAILPNVAPSNVYQTGDGTGADRRQPGHGVRAARARRWASPELATDPRYATHGARGAHQQELDALVERLDPARSTRARCSTADGRARRAGRPDLPRAGDARRSALQGARRDRRRCRTRISATCGCRTSRRSCRRRPAASARPAPTWASTTTRSTCKLLGLARPALRRTQVTQGHLTRHDDEPRRQLRRRRLRPARCSRAAGRR